MKTLKSIFVFFMVLVFAIMGMSTVALIAERSAENAYAADDTVAETYYLSTTTTATKTTIKATAAIQYFFSVEADWSRFNVVDASNKTVTGVEFRYNGKAVEGPKEVFVEGIHEYDLDMYKDGAKIGIATAYIGIKGDCSLDDKVNSKDAVKILQSFAYSMVGSDYEFNSDSDLNTLAIYLGDIDTETSDKNSLNSIDAVYTVKYYVENLANHNPTWSGLVTYLNGKNY